MRKELKLLFSKPKYDVFRKCVSISILDFILFNKEPDFYSCFHINKLNVLIVNDKRFDDLKRSSDNPGYQQKLLEEYGI